MERRPLPRHWLRTDLLTAAVLALVGCGMTWMASLAGMTFFETPLWLQFLGSVSVALPLVWRRTHSILAGGTQAVVYTVATLATGVDLYASQVALFLGFYSIGAWSTRRGWATVVRIGICVLMTAALVLGFLLSMDRAGAGAVTATQFVAGLGINAVINIAYFGGGWFFGDRAWAQALEHTELERAYDDIARLRDQLVDQAVEDERLRIARELHDVVAHHVTAMGVQSAAARRLLDRDADAAKDSLKQVESSARMAVADLRTMVLTLREADDGAGSLPTLDDVPALVSEARTQGLDAGLETIGESPELSPAAQLTAYRIVQEGLTNATKHAGPGAHVDVRLRAVPQGLEVEVADDGRGRPGAALGTGNGLRGMRERVTAVGGTVDVGPKPRGGFRIRATIPSKGQ